MPARPPARPPASQSHSCGAKHTQNSTFLGGRFSAREKTRRGRCASRMTVGRARPRSARRRGGILRRLKIPRFAYQSSGRSAHRHEQHRQARDAATRGLTGVRRRHLSARLVLFALRSLVYTKTCSTGSQAEVPSSRRHCCGADAANQPVDCSRPICLSIARPPACGSRPNVHVQVIICEIRFRPRIKHDSTRSSSEPAARERGATCKLALGMFRPLPQASKMAPPQAGPRLNLRSTSPAFGGKRSGLFGAPVAKPTNPNRGTSNFRKTRRDAQPDGAQHARLVRLSRLPGHEPERVARGLAPPARPGQAPSRESGARARAPAGVAPKRVECQHGVREFRTQSDELNQATRLVGGPE
ncbi:Hypothetical predicted protein [Olea europaea subsp. europaea]|uniref:Uncharacterized protein n=1 Tax=Olea europaea subsp. europaea TaxID=158383 RepID=A0A8S0TNR0_OLEEU|nr:Hypothetical predicted protein [Olea europaea subsp. europaea]